MKFTVDKSWWYEGVEMWNSTTLDQAWEDFTKDIMDVEDILDFHKFVVEQKNAETSLESVLKHILVTHKYAEKWFHKFNEVVDTYWRLQELQDYAEVGYTDMEEEQKRLINQLYI